MESGFAWLLIVLFGAFHGVNPGMGWLFALSAGLQARNERALWLALSPIAFGHAASVAVFAVAVLLGLRFFPMAAVQIVTALLLLVFGVYKLINWYRHPRWVGMKVGMRRLFLWSFLMATAHGAGLMIAPALTQVAAPRLERGHQEVNDASIVESHASDALHGSDESGETHRHGAAGASESVAEASRVSHADHFGPLHGGLIWLGVLVHTVAMLLVMGSVALIVYRKLGLAVLRQAWINFDLIWAVALLLVGGMALVLSLMGKGVA